MSNSMQLIICTFDAATKATEVSRAIRDWDRHVDAIKLGNIAIVQKTSDGQVSFRETQDMGQELSQVAGAVVGGLTWLVYAVAGSFGPIAGPMGRFGAQTSVRRLVGDMGFPDNALAEVGRQLDMGSSALITLVRPEEAPLVISQLERLGGTIVEHTVAPEIVASLLQDDESRS